VTGEVVLLALLASGCTAMASVAQRRAAAPAPGELSFSWRLAGYLLHRPVWFLGIACMIGGFIFQVEALRLGSLSLVQPLIATELVIVFGLIALHDRRRVQARDWLSAVGMVVGLGSFLALARPSLGHDHASPSVWTMAAVATFALAAVVTGLAYLPGRQGRRPSSARKASLLGIAAATGFGFVAAVVKELSTHLSQGPSGVFLNWSPYVLIISGAAAMFLASNAFQSGSLAASQPGLTIVDPLVASALGVVLFGERLNVHPLALTGEALALVLIVASVVTLSRSPLVQDQAEPSGVVAPGDALTDAAPEEALTDAAPEEALRRAAEVAPVGTASVATAVGTVTTAVDDAAAEPAAPRGAPRRARHPVTHRRTPVTPGVALRDPSPVTVPEAARHRRAGGRHRRAAREAAGRG
jgi:drug/metabolite transporter (DMT)-like permease